MNVHPGDHKTLEVSLIELVDDYYAGKLNSLTFKPSLIHRIDRDTSGVVMIAKKKNILTQLSSDFKNHTNLKKTYFAIVIGKVSRNK
jgi:23S rRNA-/tRNA-specific pseudouridylate synthase